MVVDIAALRRKENGLVLVAVSVGRSMGVRGGVKGVFLSSKPGLVRTFDWVMTEGGREGGLNVGLHIGNRRTNQEIQDKRFSLPAVAAKP